MKKSEVLALRLGSILARLNQGERLDINQLAEEFQTSVRTLQRDLKDRLAFLDWEEYGARYYKLNRAKFGYLQQEEIERFALFASISELFPKVDREFYQEKLTQSIQVKGFEYENISHLAKEFELLNTAIKERKFIHFQYKKSGQIEAKFYQIAPYSLTNKNGIWYLIGTENDQKKTFCFTQMSMLRKLEESFEPNEQFIEEIKSNDSIYFGNQLSEVIVQVSADVAPYFLRRNLLPNQKLVHKLENGGLLLACENINEREIIPLVQYWIPHLSIISPSNLQTKMLNALNDYLSTNKGN